MEISNILITQIKPYPKNNKKHPESQIKKIADSIKIYGFNVPILLDKDNNIIAGYGCLEASIKLGLTSVSCLTLENLSKDQIKAYRIMDNKSAESEWEIELDTKYCEVICRRWEKLVNKKRELLTQQTPVD